MIQLEITIPRLRRTCLPDEVHGVPQGRPLRGFLLSRRVVNISPATGFSSGNEEGILWQIIAPCSPHCLSGWPCPASVLSVISMPDPESSKTGSPSLSPPWICSKVIRSGKTPPLVATSGLELSFSRFICVLYNFHLDIFSLLPLL